ncbi:hypothetical protein [Georgenia deserti]|uniref:ABC transporter permease n=1 Tax=Georgenia deserti TaxID=2093781 RepID=A0ABW4L4S9_9MICO
MQSSLATYFVLAGVLVPSQAAVFALYITGQVGESNGNLWAQIPDAMRELAPAVSEHGWTVLAILATLIVAITVSLHQVSRRMDGLMAKDRGRTVVSADVRARAWLEWTLVAEFVAALSCAALALMTGIAGIWSIAGAGGVLLFAAAILLMLWGLLTAVRSLAAVNKRDHIGHALGRAQRRSVLAGRRPRVEQASRFHRQWAATLWWVALLAIAPVCWAAGRNAPTNAKLQILALWLPALGVIVWSLTRTFCSGSARRTGATRTFMTGGAVMLGTVPASVFIGLMAALFPATPHEMRAVVALGVTLWVIVLGTLLALGESGSGPLRVIAREGLGLNTVPKRALRHARRARLGPLNPSRCTSGTKVRLAGVLVATAIGTVVLPVMSITGSSANSTVDAGTWVVGELLVLVPIAFFVLGHRGPARATGLVLLYAQPLLLSILLFDHIEADSFSQRAAATVAFATVMFAVVAVCSGTGPREVLDRLPSWLFAAPALFVASKVRKGRNARARLLDDPSISTPGRTVTGCGDGGCGTRPRDFDDDWFVARHTVVPRTAHARSIARSALSPSRPRPF